MTYTPQTRHSIPKEPGIYQFYDKGGGLLYVGKAVDLKSRVATYFHTSITSLRTKRMVDQIATIRIIRTESNFDALLLEAKLIHDKQPRYNVIAKDDKHPLYIKITKETYPRIYTVRKEDDKRSIYYGPFPSSRAVKDTIRTLRDVFPFCTEKRVRSKPCFYSHIGLCNPCPNTIEQLPEKQRKPHITQYRNNISMIKRILNGNTTRVIKDKEKEMRKLSKKEMYEEAQELKNTIDKLNHLTTKRINVKEYLENPSIIRDRNYSQIADLKAVLGLTSLHKIEGYDISNIQGSDPTGSMVVFVDGEQDKRLYRKFKIQSKNTPDDFHMMQEMIQRRLRHSEWKKPDLMVIDGGKGQVAAVLDTLQQLKKERTIIGLAKREETIIVPSYNNTALYFKEIALEKDRPALLLLQRVRDESHRFARSYHRLLRSKRMLY